MLIRRLQFLVFYFSYLAWPALALLIYWLGRSANWANILAGAATCLFIYARFIEPRLLFSRQLKLKLTKRDLAPGRLRIGILTDIHSGVYEQAGLLARAVKRLNSLKPDLVFLPGDFIYHLQPFAVKRRLEPLKNLTAPALAVDGNHDVGWGRFGRTKKAHLLDSLRQALNELGVIFLDNKITTLKSKGYNLAIFGLADFWAGLADFSILSQLPAADLIFGLVHNPDAVYEFKDFKKPIDLVVCGHTHGGQVRIPWLYKKMIPCRHNFIAGFYTVKGVKVYVSSGLGLTGLPLRLFQPPRVELIEVEIKNQ